MRGRLPELVKIQLKILDGYDPSALICELAISVGIILGGWVLAHRKDED